MPNKEFLEDYSLFRKFKMDVPGTMDNLEQPAVNMVCKTCSSNETFNMVNKYQELHGYSNVPTANENLRLIYLCQSCKKQKREFCIYVSTERDYIYKYGQYPEWEIKIDKGLEKTLHKHSKAFRKGLVCESQGYGIGAFAYYRRITEDIIDELLESITELIDTEHRDEYIEALEKTKTTRVAQEKINLVKDLLPSILKPNGMNPLGVLHSELSEGLHAESDESCLENANHIKSILIFLLNQIVQSKESARGFTESMKSLLSKKMNK